MHWRLAARAMWRKPFPALPRSIRCRPTRSRAWAENGAARRSTNVNGTPRVGIHHLGLSHPLQTDRQHACEQIGQDVALADIDVGSHRHAPLELKTARHVVQFDLLDRDARLVERRRLPERSVALRFLHPHEAVAAYCPDRALSHAVLHVRERIEFDRDLLALLNVARVGARDPRLDLQWR